MRTASFTWNIVSGARMFLILVSVGAVLGLVQGCAPDVDGDPSLVAQKFVVTCLADMDKTRWKLLSKSSKDRLENLRKQAPKELELMARDFLVIRPVASEYWAGNLSSKVLEKDEKRAVVQVTSAIGKRTTKVVLVNEGGSWKVSLPVPGPK